MKKKIAVLSGAGISAESGIRTFRDADGLWNSHNVEDLASPQGWRQNPQTVLEFYNERRRRVLSAQPNAAHLALQRLERHYEVSIITQNVDDLHERAGSTSILHLHGEIMKARSSLDPSLIYDTKGRDIKLGQLCPKGSQLRPHIVWFGEQVDLLEPAAAQVWAADIILVIGTSLNVYPAAALVNEAKSSAEKYLISLDVKSHPAGYIWYREKACTAVPRLADKWLMDAR